MMKKTKMKRSVAIIVIFICPCGQKLSNLCFKTSRAITKKERNPRRMDQVEVEHKGVIFHFQSELLMPSCTIITIYL